jgi:hypothetical protein
MTPRITFVTAAVLSGFCLLACAKTVIDQPTSSDTSKTLPSDKTGTEDSGSPDSGKQSTTKDSGTTKNPQPDPNDPNNPNNPTGGECSNEATGDDCTNCCATAHQTGANTFYGTLIDCLCTGSCGTQCAQTLCNQTNPAQPDTTCNACIQANGGSCQNAVTSACGADPDCMAFEQCLGDSQCSSKP